MDLQDLEAALAGELAAAEAESKAARASRTVSPEQKAKTRAARNRRHNDKLQAEKRSKVAVLDMETDPFNNVGQDRIHPFAACITSDHFDAIEIWDENPDTFIEKVISAIESLPDKFTIYAHNGGKFDYLFLVHRLRGRVSFKGRGIMAARIGLHELRDSFHILPEKLAAYRKDEFDYSKMEKGKRRRHRAEIQKYLRNDCIYLLDFVKEFIAENGLKLSIGQAALAKAKEVEINVANINEQMDNYLRQFYFGGRVECIDGAGEFRGDYKLYDVNSMYPAVMADRLHPVGSDYIIRKGAPGPHTIFIDLNCRNHGALVARDADGGTTAAIREGRFKTTIWEFNVARAHNLIEGIRINFCVDCVARQSFADFVIPKYAERQTLKKRLKTLTVDTEEYLTTKIHDILLKFYLNNLYGKYAQNPRKYRESFLTDTGDRPDWSIDDGTEKLAASVETWGELPVYDNPDMGYAIWEKPVEKLRFKNVGTSASITGASRAMLLDAICNAVDPIYCDTDSLICKSLNNVPLHPTDLGAWDLEDEFDVVRIVGKKLYACQRIPERAAKAGKPHKFASKGVAAPTWDEFQAMLEGAVVHSVAKGPTLTRRGSQTYVTRAIRKTAGAPNVQLRLKLGA